MIYKLCYECLMKRMINDIVNLTVQDKKKT